MFLNQCINCIQVHILNTNTSRAFATQNTKHVILICSWCIYSNKDGAVAASNYVGVDVNSVSNTVPTIFADIDHDVVILLPTIVLMLLSKF